MDKAKARLSRNCDNHFLSSDEDLMLLFRYGVFRVVTLLRAVLNKTALKIIFFVSSLAFYLTVFAMPNKTLNSSIAELEVGTGGKIGIYVINTANNKTFHYRENERFPMGCTSKVMGVAAILKKNMQQPDLLQKRVNYTKADLTNWSPVTAKHLHFGMTIEALCAAAISYSDNTAMNLLVKELGGLKEINSFAYATGNTTFRQDHGWPEEAMSGSEGNLDDSSTPKDMAESLERLVLSKVLGEAQRQLLVNWLQLNTTGNHRHIVLLANGDQVI